MNIRHIRLVPARLEPKNEILIGSLLCFLRLLLLRSESFWISLRRLPEVPLLFPHDPQAEEEVCDRVRRHRIAETILPHHET